MRDEDGTLITEMAILNVKNSQEELAKEILQRRKNKLKKEV